MTESSNCHHAHMKYILMDVECTRQQQEHTGKLGTSSMAGYFAQRWRRMIRQ